MRTRRSVLASAAGGAAAAALALATPTNVLAANDEPLLLGADNHADSLTKITRDTVGDSDAATFLAVNTISAGVVGHATSGPGVVGRSETGAGVQGYSQTDAGVNGFGVLGIWAGGSDVGVHGNGPGIGAIGLSTGDSTGVVGVSQDGLGDPEPRPKTGVFGYAAQDVAARGVVGSTTLGQGVRGEATTGIGGAFTATSGVALLTSGRLRFEKVSGVATLAPGTHSKTVNAGVELTAASFVLLTPRRSLNGRDLWYTVDAAANRFTIRVSSNVSVSTSIGWLLLG